jgi:hypothetical protein
METTINTQYTDIFQKGCLVVLSISTWSGTVKIDRKTVETRMQSDQCKASKFLMPEKSLDDIQKQAGIARNWLRAYSLPFPLKGACFIPFDLIEQVDTTLQSIKNEFNSRVEWFVERYPLFREMVRVPLERAGLFNEDEYPMNIQDKFSFQWRFIQMSAPGENKLLSPDFIRREQAKFIETLKEAEQLGIQALRGEFIALINNAVDRLTLGPEDEKKKIFKNSTVEKFSEFFETFTARNCFGDSDLSTLVEKAKLVMNGITPDSLRSDDKFRTEIALEIAKVKTEIDSGIINLPGRKLSFD